MANATEQPYKNITEFKKFFEFKTIILLIDYIPSSTIYIMYSIEYVFQHER